MASPQSASAFKLSLLITVPLVLDLAYQEGYLVPTTLPNFYTESRLEELRKSRHLAFSRPPSLLFTRYHTENPRHVEYVDAKKSFWRYNTMWSFLGLASTTLQMVHVTNCLGAQRPGGAVAAAAAVGLTWAAILVEGNARKLYLEAMYEKVVEEEERKGFKS